MGDDLRAISKRMKRKKRALHSIVDSGGSLELFVGIFVDRNSGFTLDSQVLEHLGLIRFSVAFDIYGPPVNRKLNKQKAIS